MPRKKKPVPPLAPWVLKRTPKYAPAGPPAGPPPMPKPLKEYPEGVRHILKSESRAPDLCRHCGRALPWEPDPKLRFCEVHFMTSAEGASLLLSNMRGTPPTPVEIGLPSPDGPLPRHDDDVMWRELEPDS